MIIYATKKAFERYNLKMPEEMHSSFAASVSKAIIKKESGDRLCEWGAKLFYFAGKKCLLLTNFETKLCIVLVDFKVGNLAEIGDWIITYLIELYKNDKEMLDCMEIFFSEHLICCFSRLKDKVAISVLNHAESDYLFYGDRFYDFLEGNVLQTKKLVHNMNFDRIIGYKDENGRNYYEFPGVKFREAMIKRYGNRVKELHPPIGSPFAIH